MNADGSALTGALNPTNTGQALRVDSNGNLKVVAASDLSMPTITEDRLRNWIINGQGFIGGTDVMNSATGTNNNPLCIFNPATSGKSILIYSFGLSSGTAGTSAISAFMQYVTANPGYSSAAVVVNARAGGSASAIASSCTFTTINQVIAGPSMQFVSSTTPIEMLSNGSVILLPAGSANGVTVFLQTYAVGIGNITARWIEL